MDKVTLTQEKETLLIPLYGKAKESAKKSPIIVDKDAIRVVNQIDYDFASLHIPEKTNVMMCLRAKLIDNFVEEFLSNNPNSVALHLGCGLDSRYHRIGHRDVDWYDIDFPQVIDVRRLFFTETEHYQLIPSSVTENAWLERIPARRKSNIVIAEGLLMYLKEQEIKELLHRLNDKLGCYTLIFDAFSVFAAKQTGKHPSIKKTGAVIHWGIDDPEEITKWGNNIRFIREEVFTSNKEIEKLETGFRIAFKLANAFPLVKRAQRILIYEVQIP